MHYQNKQLLLGFLKSDNLTLEILILDSIQGDILTLLYHTIDQALVQHATFVWFNQDHILGWHNHIGLLSCIEIATLEE